MARKFACVLGMLLLVGAMLPVTQQNAFAMPDPVIIITHLATGNILSEGDIIYVDKEDRKVQLGITVNPSSSTVTMFGFPGATFETITGGYRFSWPIDGVIVSDPGKPVMYGVTFTARNGNEVATKSAFIGVEQNLRATVSLDRTGYSAGDTATITVRDPHANRNALAVDTTVAEVRHTGAGIPKADVTLTESPNDPDVFVGEFTVQNGKKLFVRYGDASPASADIGRFMTLDQSVYHLGEKAKFTLHDELKNLNLAQADVMQFRISSGAQTITILVSETTVDSGTFEGEVQLGFGTDSSLPVLQVLQNSLLGDQIVVAAGEHVAKAGVIEPGFEISHSVGATKDTDMATFTLKDRNLNTDSKTKQTVQVNVQSGASSIVNTLIETGPDTGIFRSANKMVLTSDSALVSESPQHSLVVQNDRIAATYPAIASTPAVFAVEIEPSPVVPPELAGIGTDASSPIAADPIFPGITLLECNPIDLDGDGQPDGDGDLDDDGICDAWEAGGPLRIPYESATPHIFQFSCTPECPSSTTKDVFVEIDYDASYPPNQIALNYVMDRFNFADPVDNPSGINGIKLHNILSDPLPHELLEKPYIWSRSDPPNLVDSYTEIKSQYFGISHPNPSIGFHLSTNATRTMAWANAVHYLLWMYTQNHNTKSSGLAEVIGNDMIVSLGGFRPDPTAVDKQQGTYLHELGHNLGLGHGGALVHPDNSINCKPNYLSVMSYARQMTTYYSGSGQDYSRGIWPTSLSVGMLNEFVTTPLPNAYIIYGTGETSPSNIALTSQYTFDGNANDSVGSNNLVLSSNPPTFIADGQFGGAIQFNGVDQDAQAASHSVFDVTTQDFTIWGMFYRAGDSGNTEHLVRKLSSISGGGYFIRINPDDKLEAMIYDGSVDKIATSSSTVAVNTWYFFAASYDKGQNGSLTLYLHNLSTGALDAASTDISGVGSATNTQIFTLARSSYASNLYFTGYIDNLSFVDGTALSREQVSEIINQYVYGTGGAGPSVTPLTSQYTFDDAVNDAVGSNDLSLPEGSTFGTDGPSGDYIIFNGSTQYAQPSSYTDFDVTTQDFTIWGMFYRAGDSGNTEHIVRKLGSIGGGYFIRINPYDKLEAEIFDGSRDVIATSSSSIAVSTWYFFAASYDKGQNGSLTLYLHNLSTGVMETATADLSLVGSASNTETFTVGRNSVAENLYFAGYIDNLSFVDGTALSREQVSEIINQYVYGLGSNHRVIYVDGSTDWIDWNGNNAPDIARNDITDIGIVGCTPSTNQFDHTIPLGDHNDWRDIVSIPYPETSSALNFRSANPAAVATGSSILSHGLDTDDLKDFRKKGIRSVAAAIQGVDDLYFNGNATLIKADYHKDLILGSSNILSLVASDDIQKAVARLEKIRETMDESAGGNPADDKIEFDGQSGVLPVLDSNIAALKMELDEPYKAPHTFQVKSYSGNKVYTITGNSTTISSAVNTFTFNNSTKTINLDLIGSGDVLLEIPSELVTTVTDVSNAGTPLTFFRTNASPTVKVLIKDLPYYPRSTNVSAGGIVPPKAPLDVFPTQDIGPGTELTVTVSDCDINNDSDLINMGNVTVTVDNGSTATLKVIETGVNTCIFVGTVTLNPNEHPGSAGSGTAHVTINVVPGDIVAVRYEYVEGGMTKTAAKTFEVESEDPVMTTTEGIYREGDIIGLTIDDFDVNLDSRSFDSIEVRVTSDSDPVGFDVTAIETERDSGIFSITVPTTTSASSGAITARTGDDIYFEYTDRFPADYVDRLGSVSDPSKDFILTVRIAPDGITSIDPGTPTLEDISGNPLTEVSAGMQVIISSTIKNNSDVAQPFAAVIEVRDADGFTIFLSWQTGTLPANGDAEPGLSWTPAAPGDYTIRVFVLESVSSPTVLSPIAELAVTVDGSGSVHLPPVSPPSSGTIAVP